ncbi:MAG: CoA-binding protein, partial [Promethearchaeota archaeon]
MTKTKKPSIVDILDIKSAAIVGVSSSLGYFWVHCMTQWNHNLKLWLVSKREGEALGRKIYTSVLDIPEQFDFAIIAVPYRAVPQALRECHEKGAKVVSIFTSGFSELGTQDGKQRELEIQEILNETGMRAFGPNCMGLLYPELGISFIPNV